MTTRTMMRSASVGAIAALTALTFSACGGSKSKKDGLVDDVKPNPAYLAAIPADTPYAFASLDAMPLAPVLEKFEGLGKSMDEMIDEINAEMAKMNDPDAQKFGAVMNLFKGKLSRQGYESMGFSMNPRFAVYGVGFLPVFRMELKDPKAFQNFLDQVYKAAEIQPMSGKRGELAYQYFEESAGGGKSMQIPIVFQGNEVILGATPSSFSEKYLPYVLGEKAPEQSMATSKTLESIRDTYGFKGFGIAFVDLQRIIKVATAPTPDLNGETWVALDMETSPIDPLCQQEYMQIGAHYPRVVAGYDRIDSEAMEFRMGLETTNGLGSDLQKAKGYIPGLNAQDAMMNMGIGINVQGLLDMLRTRASALRESPFQCPNLSMFNNYAEQFANASMMAPPALTQLTGAHVALTNFTIPSLQPTQDEGQTPQPPDGSISGDGVVAPTSTFEGFVYIASQEPGALVETMKLMNPALATLSIKADGEPVALTGIPGTEALVEPHAIMTKDGIVIASGEGASALAADAARGLMRSGESPMFYLRYDLSSLMGLLAQNPTGSATSDDLIKKLMDQGPVIMTVDPNESGIFMKLTQSWPNP